MFPAQLPQNTPVALSTLPSSIPIQETFPAGILLIGYGAGVAQNAPNPASSNDPNTSTTRYGFVEFTAPGVADNTYIDQFGVPTRVDTFDAAGQPVDTRAPVCNADSIRRQLLEIPGAAEKRGPSGEFLRVVGPSKLGVSPLFPQTYPSLDPYVASLEGQTLSVTTLFVGGNVATYSGVVQGGAITLSGTMTAPPVGGAQPIAIPLTSDGIYGANGPYTVGAGPATTLQNDVYGQIYNRVVSGFGLGYWGGRYGNALDDRPGTPTPGWWGQEAFAAARTAPAPFPAYSAYAAVIARTAQAYGFPFSDSLPFNPQAGLPAGGTLRVTILNDQAPEPSSCDPPPPPVAPPPLAPPPTSAAPPPAPSAVTPVCDATPRRSAGDKGTITLSERALRIQQRIDSAALRRLDAVNDWIDAGVIATDLCAGGFGPSAFQAGITWRGGAAATAQTPPSPRPLSPPRARRSSAEFTVSLRQVRINERISKALVARAQATWRRVNGLTGGNLAPQTTLAGRPLIPGLAPAGAMPPSRDGAATRLIVPRSKGTGKVTLSAAQLRRTQRQSQRAIRLANRVTDRIEAGLTESQFQPGSIGAGRL